MSELEHFSPHPPAGTSTPGQTVAMADLLASHERVLQLENENIRLQRMITELLLRMQQMRDA